ncbi:hypothetical protein SDC9_94570 [bioreactor metagenome]|uniref:Primosomal protein N' (Replication factor Y)-superfamily II helicase n=1 Tax=bioreactor metagenome TaxID=1076179 RepID=A0A645A3T5_9ZZZZ
MNTTEPITDALQTKCASCGGIMQYSPADGNLKCLYCSHVGELDLTPVRIAENDFFYWKDRANENNEEQTEEVSEIKCRQCGATTTLPPNVSGAKCAFCNTPLIMQEVHIKRFWQPEYLLPFKITEKESSTNFKKWLNKKWYLPNKLKKGSVHTDNFKGVYLPFWTYDSHNNTDYRGERGEDRQQSYTNNKGEKVERTVTDWYPARGNVTIFFDDIIIPAAQSLPPNIMNQLTNWDMMNCVAYRKEFLAGFITEIYQRDFRESFNYAKKKMDDIIRENVRSDIGGDHQRIHSIQTRYDDLKFKHLLLPVWISSFKYNNKVYQFVVNGRTGQVVGQYPKSKAKIAMTIIAIAAIIMILYLMVK